MLHGQVSLAAVNQSCVIHEAMEGCKNLKIYLRISSKMYTYIDVSFIDNMHVILLKLLSIFSGVHRLWSPRV